MHIMTIPAEAKRIPIQPLAMGEKTGHHHSLISTGSTAVEDQAEMFELTTEDGVRHFLRVTGDNIAVEHQEHKPHAIAPGDYEVVIQRENTDWGSRPVED